jgi:hypothetical protein
MNPYAAGLAFHQRKHVRESGQVPAVESLKNTKLPAIPTEVKAAHRDNDQKRPAVSAVPMTCKMQQCILIICASALAMAQHAMCTS